MSDTRAVKGESRPFAIYVFNFTMLVILGLVVVVAINVGLWLLFDKQPAVRHALHWDWTRDRIHSLSDSTTKLIKQVDNRNEKWELALIDPGPLSIDDSGVVTRSRLTDLLQEYAGQSRTIKFKAYGNAERLELESRIREHFADEIKPYETALANADKTYAFLKKFFEQEGALQGALSQANGVPEDEARGLERSQAQFLKTFPTELERTRKKVQETVESTLPEYSDAVQLARSGRSQEYLGLDQWIEVLQGLISLPDSDAAKSFSAPSKAYFNQMAARGKVQLDAAQKTLRELSDLKPLEMDSVRSSIGPDAVVIFSPKAVKVIPPSAMMHEDAGDQNTRPIETFAGEQPISTAILAIVRPVKPKVVFVSATASNLVHGDYSDFADRLTAQNFDVLEWSPASRDPANINPPAVGKGVVWVVFPPPAFDPQSGQIPSSKPLVDAVQAHMAAGGNAMFLAQAGGRSPMLPGMGGDMTTFPLNDITAQFGIVVRSQYTIVHKEPTQDGGELTYPMVRTRAYEDVDIAKPMQGKMTIFFIDRRTGQGGPTPLEISKKLPPNTTVTPILKLDGSQFWATMDPSQTEERNDNDLTGNLILVAAGSQTRNGQEQRIVVVGNAAAATDGFMKAAIPTETGIELRFPGNGELFANTIMWLAGYENMIAVSPRSNASARIAPMSDGLVKAIDISLIFGVPLLLLALGSTIYVIRRR